MLDQPTSFSKDYRRIKKHQLGRVLSAVEKLAPKQRKQLITDVALSVDSGTPKARADQDAFGDAIDILEDYTWTEPLVKSLKAKAASLKVKEEAP
jgi:hypothetical protein